MQVFCQRGRDAGEESPWGFHVLATWRGCGGPMGTRETRACQKGRGVGGLSVRQRGEEQEKRDKCWGERRTRS